MGDKSPKANQKKSAQKQAKAGNASQAKKQAAAQNRMGTRNSTIRPFGLAST
jgi:hypothetical protein